MLAVSELFEVSVAVSVWLPVVFNVTLNVPVPPLRFELAGRTAAGSLLLKRTVSAYDVTVLP